MTTMSAIIPTPSPVPSIAAYNVRFLSLSDSSEQRAQYQRKLANVQYLVQQYTMTAILETHVTGAKTELFFCRYVEGTRRFFTHGMAVIVQESWADHFNPVLVTVVDCFIVALVWECDGSKHFAFFFRLDAHAEATRIHQLLQVSQWEFENVSNADIVFFAWDRNFVRSERWSSASSVWRPSLRMNTTWDEWLSSMGHAYEVVQPEFTWCRVNTDNSDHASWIYEIIDVVVSNYKFYSPKGIRCTARRGDDLPHPGTSDHFPVGLWWSSAKKTRKPQNSSDNIVHRPIHRGCLITQNFNVLQMIVLICGLLTETAGSLVCRPLLVQCMLVHPHFFLPLCHHSTSKAGVNVNNNAVAGASSN